MFDVGEVADGVVGEEGAAGGECLPSRREKTGRRISSKTFSLRDSGATDCGGRMSMLGCRARRSAMRRCRELE